MPVKKKNHHEIRSCTCVVVSGASSSSSSLHSLAVASLQLAASPWAVSFLVALVSAVREGQPALVHTVHVQRSFPPCDDVTAHSDEHDSPCLWCFSLPHKCGTPTLVRCNTVTSLSLLFFLFFFTRDCCCLLGGIPGKLREIGFTRFSVSVEHILPACCLFGENNPSESCRRNARTLISTPKCTQPHCRKEYQTLQF